MLVADVKPGEAWSLDIGGVTIEFDLTLAPGVDDAVKSMLGPAPLGTTSPWHRVTATDAPPPDAKYPITCETTIDCRVAEGDQYLWIESQGMVAVTDQSTTSIHVDVASSLADPYIVVMGIFNHVARRQGWVALHAALVESTAGALLILGQSGRGKSTSAGAALGLGWVVSGDDIVFLRPAEGNGVLALGMPRALSVPDEAIPAGHIGSAKTDHRTRRRLSRFSRNDEWALIVATIEVDHGVEAATTTEVLSPLGLVQALVRSEGFSRDNPGQDDVTKDVMHRLTIRPSHQLLLGANGEHRLQTTMATLSDLALQLAPHHQKAVPAW